MTIALTFSVAWLPYQLTRIVKVAHGLGQHAASIIGAVGSLSYVNSCINPVVYALLWRPFRQSLVEVRP